ncbi:hypothetical protein GYMLUDRAFT_342400 [Collybiopsis luxurians FD-317 M1]|nr:hypothetical protein GYMLUDRAFT_342400 [Collybiopsis luxurians FD-317 M1]
MSISVPPPNKPQSHPQTNRPQTTNKPVYIFPCSDQSLTYTQNAHAEKKMGSNPKESLSSSSSSSSRSQGRGHDPKHKHKTQKHKAQGLGELKTFEETRTVPL